MTNHRHHLQRCPDCKGTRVRHGNRCTSCNGRGYKKPEACEICGAPMGNARRASHTKKQGPRQ